MTIAIVISFPIRSSQSEVDYVAAGADPVEEGEVSEEEKNEGGIGYSPSSPPRNARTSATKRSRKKGNVVYEAASPKRPRSGREHDDGRVGERRASGGSTYLAVSESDDSDCVIVLD